MVRRESQKLCCECIYIYIFVCFSDEARIMIMMIFTVNWSMSQWSRFDQTIESSVRQNENSE